MVGFKRPRDERGIQDTRGFCLRPCALAKVQDKTEGSSFSSGIFVCLGEPIKYHNYSMS